MRKRTAKALFDAVTAKAKPAGSKPARKRAKSSGGGILLLDY